MAGWGIMFRSGDHQQSEAGGGGGGGEEKNQKMFKKERERERKAETEKSPAPFIKRMLGVTVPPPPPPPPIPTTTTTESPWYNCNGWLSVKRQVTYLPQSSVRFLAYSVFLFFLLLTFFLWFEAGLLHIFSLWYFILFVS